MRFALLAAAGGEWIGAAVPASSNERALTGHGGVGKVETFTHTGALPVPREPVWRSRREASHGCDQPTQWGAWEEMEGYQHLAWEMLGWNSTMWDDWDEKPSARMWIWPPPPTTTTTTTTTTTEAPLWATPAPTPVGNDTDTPAAPAEGGSDDEPAEDMSGGGRRLRGARSLSAHNHTHNATWNASANETVGGAMVMPGADGDGATTTTTTTTEAGRQIEAKCYFHLSAAEQMAVHALGYSINAWNCFQPCPMYNLDDQGDGEAINECVRILHQLKEYHSREYQHMSIREKESLTVLGVTKEAWSGSDFEREEWDSLTKDEQNAAVILGFSLSTWNKCNMDKKQIVEEHYPTTPTPPPEEREDPFRVVQALLTLNNQEFALVSGMQSVFREAMQVELARALDIARQRILIIDLKKGGDGMTLNAQESIVVDMIIRQPPLEEMEGEITAVAAFDELETQLKDPESALRMNKYLKEYLTETELVEVKMEEGLLERREAYQEFEDLRSLYNDSTACLLLTDEKHGKYECATSDSALVALAATALLFA